MSSGAAPKRSPLTFLVLVSVLAVPFYLLGALVEPPAGFPIKLPLSALWLFCPFTAAAILVYRDDGLRGIGALLRRTVSHRCPRPLWLVAIVLLMPTVYLVSYGVMLGLGRPLSPPRIPLQEIPILLGVSFIAAVAEEAGWTGYATDPLQQRWSALQATLVIGAVWGLLHVVPDLQNGQSFGWIAWQHGVGAMAFRVLIVAAYNTTGTVLAAVALHTLDTVCWQLFARNAPYDPVITAPILAIAAVAVALRWGSKKLGRQMARPTQKVT